MLDKVLHCINEGLLDKVDWLDAAFGRVTEHNDNGVAMPKLYHTKGEYINVMPDDRRGNYSFFDVTPTYEIIQWNKHRPSLVRARFGVVFWFNLNTIFPDVDTRNLENVKSALLHTLTSEIHIPYGDYQISTISDDARGVFAKFARTGYEERYLLHPYGGIRYNGEIVFSEML